MKIVHFLPWYSPHTKGGTELFILKLASIQKANGNEVIIICPNIKEEYEIDIVNNIDVVYFSFPYGYSNKKFLEGKANHQTCDLFKKEIQKINPDVIHLHGFYPQFLKYFEGLKYYSKCKLIITVHLVNIICSNQNLVDYEGLDCSGKLEFKRCSKCIGSQKNTRKLYFYINRAILPINSLFRNLLNGATFIPFIPYQSIVQSKIKVFEFIKRNVYVDVLNPWFYDVFKVNGISSNRISYFKNPIFDRHYFDCKMQKNAANSSTNRINFLFVGRISIEKGVLLLIESIKKLKDYKNQFTVTFIGMSNNDKLIAEIGMLIKEGFNLIYLGEIKNEKLGEYFNNSDYLIFPSSRIMGEMLPLIITESFQHNLPVIASDIIAVKMIIKEGINGFLFKADDIWELSKLLDDIICRKKSIAFKFDKMVQIDKEKAIYYDHVYNSILDV